MGRSLYPKAPDMRLPRTQDLSDGEIFYFIENGIRLTGMPAGAPARPKANESSWQLVHFIRRLPKLTAGGSGGDGAIQSRCRGSRSRKRERSRIS